jgi:hypothetical protein
MLKVGCRRKLVKAPESGRSARAQVTRHVVPTASERKRFPRPGPDSGESARRAEGADNGARGAARVCLGAAKVGGFGTYVRVVPNGEARRWRGRTNEVRFGEK